MVGPTGRAWTGNHGGWHGTRGARSARLHSKQPSLEWRSWAPSSRMTSRQLPLHPTCHGSSRLACRLSRCAHIFCTFQFVVLLSSQAFFKKEPFWAMGTTCLLVLEFPACQWSTEGCSTSTSTGVGRWKRMNYQCVRRGCVAVQARTDTENWCGVLQEVALPGTGGDPETFLEAAVAYANDRCWGTLSCSLMVNPSSVTYLQLQNLPSLSLSTRVWRRSDCSEQAAGNTKQINSSDLYRQCASLTGATIAWADHLRLAWHLRAGAAGCVGGALGCGGPRGGGAAVRQHQHQRCNHAGLLRVQAHLGRLPRQHPPSACWHCSCVTGSQ